MKPTPRPSQLPDLIAVDPGTTKTKPQTAEHVDYDRRPLVVEQLDHYIDALPAENERFRVH
ncbi:hypothetical protein [Dyella tabacisoli]|uniref:Uncharacterized protein n=1 Tax=Dyella tabacisoli TaxID=2282381 RepID=A0A369UMB9_9GAMM|nr:hypothetical protein [Dyella tabacisoli]RDD81647.1 hypothetical protein DVJ77_10785 [Dyella tabacisoli]